MITAIGQQHGRRGRSPMAYVVRDNAGFVVGVDIGGTNIRVGAADIFGEPICDEQHATTKEGERALSAQLMEVTGHVVERARGTHERLLALGISTPGVVDPASHRVMLAYNVSPSGGFDPLGAIGSRWGVPVLIDNNVNLAAVGEKWFGLARGISTMVFIAIGARIGMGIIIDHELVRGAHGAAGEIGYLPLVGDPFDPRHRLHGGLEDEVAAAGILAAFRARRDADAGETPSSAEEVFALAAAGDADAREVVEHVAARLGAAIAAVCTIVDPELIVLGGGIGASPLLLRPIRSAAAALVPVTGRIETSLLGDRAALQGAIAVALNAARSELLSQGAPEARKNVAAMRLETP
jgi:predicted NBD/HSP70 family sugar kinase